MKKRIINFISKISPKLYFYIAYYHNRRRLLNLKDPKDLSSIWIQKVLSGRINDLYYLADKYLVRQYVISKGLQSILPNLIGVYDNPEEIPFSDLPTKFAIKVNYGAGMNVICQDKFQLNINAVKSLLRDWLDRPEYSQSERHYNLIQRKIIIEEFIEDGSGGFPIDYKFLCLHGKVVCCLVCLGRETGHADYIPYNKDWIPRLDWARDSDKISNKIIPRPLNLADMIKTAETLSKDLDMVRIDLYSDGRKIWFGEITLTPAGCIFHTWSNKAMDDLGSVFLQNN